jgi:multidrug efflux system membrane fusion protein
VNARLLVDTQHGVTLVPTAAIQRNAQGAFVYVVTAGDTATMRPATVGTTDGNTTAVQGVNPGDIVIVSGFDKLQDGAKVAARNGAGRGSNNAPASGNPMPPVNSHPQPNGQPTPSAGKTGSSAGASPR